MKRKIAITVSLIYVGWMAACFFYLYSQGDMYKAIVAIAGILCGAIPLSMALFSKWKMNLGIVISYLVFIFGAQYLGTILNWYSIDWWDTAMHFMSGMILGFIALGLYEGSISRNGGNDLDPWFVFLTTVSITAFAAVVWEIYEFFSDKYLGYTLQGTGVTDTMTDLIADVVGGLIVASFAAVRTKIRVKKHKTISEV